MNTFIHFFLHLPWVTIFGVLGNIISFMCLLSPIPTFYGIYKKKSTEEFQCIPYAMGLFSGALWVFYAIMKADVIFLLTINSIDVLIEIIYLTIFVIYANNKIRVNTVKLLLIFNVFGFGVIVLATLLIGKTNKTRATILGWICLVFSASVFASPLGVMRKVIKTRSVRYMPFLLSLFITMSGFVWLFYGLFKHNLYIAVPNGLGATFGVIQMVLYATYRNAKPINEDLRKDGPTNDGDFAIKIPDDITKVDASHVRNEENKAMDERN